MAKSAGTVYAKDAPWTCRRTTTHGSFPLATAEANAAGDCHCSNDGNRSRHFALEESGTNTYGWKNSLLTLRRVLLDVRLVDWFSKWLIPVDVSRIGTAKSSQLRPPRNASEGYDTLRRTKMGCFDCITLLNGTINYCDDERRRDVAHHQENYNDGWCHHLNILLAKFPASCMRWEHLMSTGVNIATKSNERNYYIFKMYPLARQLTIDCRIYCTFWT